MEKNLNELISELNKQTEGLKQLKEEFEQYQKSEAEKSSSVITFFCGTSVSDEIKEEIIKNVRHQFLN
ncbi:hypothetical protein [Limnovirga soli]|uniref:Uncharacterized protein n=1 Tax=Limnovirga soli TaxID=2656915 RepID=A0A8J8FIF7_9BACT|nr:hypothetical protein [Limnovirga soli]NNV57202.1 hypothetical protein [Limnovirga soli]